MKRALSPPPLGGAALARRARTVALWLALLSAGVAYGQAAPDNAPVTRQEYDALKKEMDALRKELAELRAAGAATQPASTEVAGLRREIAALKKSQSEQQADTEEYRKEIERVIQDVTARTDANALGNTKLNIVGDADIGFETHRNSPSTFVAGVSPRFLWELTDRIMFDAAFDISADRDDSGANTTTFDMEIADITYLVNDYIVVGAGLFVVPFGQYHQHFDPPWINPLPDDPLVFNDGGLSPNSQIGAFVQGAIPIYSTKLNYAVYASNGPNLATDTNGAYTGAIEMDNNVDLNNNKAIGGRVGFLPVPELEVGYSIQGGQASPAGNSPNVNLLLNAVDASYRKQIPAILGTFHARAEWIWSNLGSATYPDGSGGTFTTRTDANGGYALVSYRPSMVDNKILRNVETVFRYDRMDIPSNTLTGGHEQRYTVGLDYWFDPRVVLKTAYECDDIAHAGGSPAFFVHVGVGF